MFNTKIEIDKKTVTGHALNTLNYFLKYAQNTEYEKVGYKRSLEDAKEELYEVIKNLRDYIFDYECQINEAQTILKGIEYVQNYILKD